MRRGGGAGLLVKIRSPATFRYDLDWTFGQSWTVLGWTFGHLQRLDAELAEVSPAA